MNKKTGALIKKVKWRYILFKVYYTHKYREFKNTPEFYPALIAIIAILINIATLIILIKK